MRLILRSAARLVALQVVFSGVVFLLSEVGWLALLVGLGFLAMLVVSGRALAAEGGPWWSAMCAAFIAQIPGLQGSLRFASDLLGWTAYDGVTDLQDFAMETWHTVLLPLLAAIPTGRVADYYARYYIALVALSPLLILLFSLAALPVRSHLPLREKGNWK